MCFYRVLVERTRELSKRTKELEELKASNSTYLASIERKYGEETALYRKRTGKCWMQDLCPVAQGERGIVLCDEALLLV
jgi:hypothetical protein